jgi:hypothetical protein
MMLGLSARTFQGDIDPSGVFRNAVAATDFSDCGADNRCSRALDARAVF